MFSVSIKRIQVGDKLCLFVLRGKQTNERQLLKFDFGTKSRDFPFS